MKDIYERTKMMITAFDEEDVIVTSSTPEDAISVDSGGDTVDFGGSKGIPVIPIR